MAFDLIAGWFANRWQQTTNISVYDPAKAKYKLTEQSVVSLNHAHWQSSMILASVSQNFYLLNSVI